MEEPLRERASEVGRIETEDVLRNLETEGVLRSLGTDGSWHPEGRVHTRGRHVGKEKDEWVWGRVPGLSVLPKSSLLTYLPTYPTDPNPDKRKGPLG